MTKVIFFLKFVLVKVMFTGDVPRLSRLYLCCQLKFGRTKKFLSSIYVRDFTLSQNLASLKSFFEGSSTVALHDWKHLPNQSETDSVEILLLKLMFFQVDFPRNILRYTLKCELRKKLV